jgi:hypothetical protein
VAIFCGHEIQIYDGPTGEPQKTGSVYNFDPLSLGHARPTAKGEWNDYEIRIVGQQYTIIRNGEVINRFDNAIPRQSSRGGDPSTEQRQFARGYIGFQNHGSVDRIQLRNVRVADLGGAPTGTGTFTVTGAGHHTVEFRSIDVAGNIEAKGAHSFRIGQPPNPVGGGGAPDPDTGQGPGPVGPGPGPGPGAEPPAQPDRAAFGLRSFQRRLSLGRFTSRGLRVRVGCTDRMQGQAHLRVSRAWARRLGSKTRTIASRQLRCSAGKVTSVTVKPSRSMQRKLRRYDRRHGRPVPATLQVRMKASFEDAIQTQRRVTLR